MDRNSEIISGRNWGASKGIALCSVIGIMAYSLDNVLEAKGWFSLGSGTFAFIIGGIASQLVIGIRDGGRWMISKILPITIVFLGFGLNLSLLFGDGMGKLGVLIGVASAIICLISSIFIGRVLGVTLNSSLAIGSGGAICGNSAVVAVSSPLKISEEDLAITLAAINILGIVTFISIPILSTILGLEDTSAGIWAGSTIHAVPQAISAGEAIGGEGLMLATTVKLSRVALLIFVVPICIIIGGRNSNSESFTESLFRVPYFLPGFILAAILSTWFMPENNADKLASLAKLSLTPIMASIGFFITIEGIGANGSRVFAVGAISSIAMILFSYLAIYIFV